jgi:L-alanine-DL-glutamate epimerase-like enolase superfamily enzyme
LKVVDLQTVAVPGERLPPRTIRMDLVIVRVLTDEGIEGNSFAWGGNHGGATAKLIDAMIKPLVFGEDPHFTEKIWQKARTRDRLGGHFPRYLYGPVDVALWDVCAKRANLPLYQYLGAHDDKILAYASSGYYPTADEYAADALKAKEQGYTAYKLHPPSMIERGPAYLKDVKACETVRRAVGDEMVLMSDPVASYNLQQATYVGRALERLNYLWLEEPLWDQHIEAYVELAQTLDIAICGTEWGSDGLSGVSTTAEYIVRHAVDIVRSDVSWKGGVTGLLKTAALAEAFGLQCEIHMTLYSMLDLANLHVACAISNCQYLELCASEACSFGLVDPPHIDREGYVHAPSGPGLGVEIDWPAINALL